MGFKIKITSHIDVHADLRKVNTDKFWKTAASEWWRLITPYTPMLTGTLSESVRIYPKEIHYTAPYAHYIYAGKTMGDSRPIMVNGMVNGFFSPKGERKHYTGNNLQISRSKHLLASKEWDKAAMPTQRPKLIEALQILVDRGDFHLGK